MRQAALLPSGPQVWAKQACAASESHYAYCSTLSIYIHRSSDDKLVKVVCGGEKNITALCWSPHDPSLLVFASADNTMRAYTMETDSQLTATKGRNFSAGLLEWAMVDPKLVYAAGSNVLVQWNVHTNDVQSVKEFSSKVESVSCNRLRKHMVAVASDDTVHFWNVLDKSWSRFKFAGPVCAAKWDHLSETYLLTALKDGSIFLHDADQQAQMMAFSKQTMGLSDIFWMPGMPGGFVTTSAKAAVLRLWNVSQTSPQAVLKLGKAVVGGVVSLAPVGKTTRLVCTTKDGACVVYDCGLRRAKHSILGGHTETVFDCAFCPADPEVLASASYDNTVKLWNMTTRECAVTLTGATGSLYSVAWSPDGSQVASSSSEGKVFLYDLERGRVRQALADHKAPVFRVSFSHDGSRLASASSDESVCVYSMPDGALQHRLPHGTGVFGVAWSTMRPDLLATATMGKKVTLWDMSKAQPTKTELAGHTARVFGLAWSPLHPDLLASTSDDFSTRVWDVAAGSSVALSGHTANVRGVAWHTEVPWMLFTGSWDASVRVWDTRTGTCIAKATDHLADVYGISLHPSRPFLVATCSRDSTIRTWSLEPHFSVVQSRAVAHGLKTVRATVEECMHPGSPAMLAGRVSAELASGLEVTKDPMTCHAALFEFFSPCSGVRRMFQLAATCKSGQPAGGLDPDQARVLHMLETAPVLAGRAKELEAAGGRGATEEARAAATTRLQLGDVEGYCEAMKAMGEWEKALVVAPGVSAEYWRSLVQQYTAHLERAEGRGADVAESAPLYAVSGQQGRLVELYAAAGELDAAFAVAESDASGAFGAAGGPADGSDPAQAAAAGAPKAPPTPPPASSLPSLAASNGPGRLAPLGAPKAGALGSAPLPSLKGGVGGASRALSPADRASRRRALQPRACGVRARQAEQFLRDGEPVWAACCHLSVDEPGRAVHKLVRAHQPELAAALAETMMGDDGARLAARLRIERMESLGLWDEAAHLAARLPDGDLQVKLIAARFTGDAAQAEEFYARHKLAPASEWLSRVSGAKGDRDAVLYQLLGRDSEGAAERGVRALRAALERPAWCLAELRPLVRVLGCVRGESLSKRARDELLAYCAYLGGLDAIERGYGAVVPHLMEFCRRTVTQAALQFAVPLALVTLQEVAFTRHESPAAAAGSLRAVVESDSTPPHLAEVARAMLAQQPAGERPHGGDNAMRPLGTAMSASSAASVFKAGSGAKDRLTGSSIVLEDGNTSMGFADACMWAAVMPYSPLGTGQWLAPR